MNDVKHEVRVGDEGRGKSLGEARDALMDGGKEADRVRDYGERRVIASYPFPLSMDTVRSIAFHQANYPDAEIRPSKDKKSLDVWSHPKK